MFQIVETQEIFDQNFWQVSEKHPAYWLAQLRKKEWTRLLLLSMKPARSGLAFASWIWNAPTPRGVRM